MTPLKVTIYYQGQTEIREVNKETFTVGRTSDCDISLNDGSISRMHLVVGVRANKVWIEDKNSSNGTFISGVEIEKKVPVQVVPEDRIQLGTSSYMISIGFLKLDAKVEIPKIPSQVATADLLKPPERGRTDRQSEDSLSERNLSGSKEPHLREPISKKNGKSASREEEFVAKTAPLADKFLYEAKRKAAQVIIEAEAQAEKKAQSVFEKARSIQEQAEQFYEKRIAEAHKEADAIMADIQRQSQDLLGEARKMAEKLREDVDIYISSLRSKTKSESDEILAEADRQAEKLKLEAVTKGTQEGEKVRDDLVARAQEEASKMIEASRQEVANLQEQSKDENELLQRLKKEIEESQRTLTLQAEALEDLNLKMNVSTEDLVRQEATLGELRENQTELSEKKKGLEDQIRELLSKQVDLNELIQDLENRKVQMAKEFESQRVLLNEKVAQEKIQIEKQTEERAEELQAELFKKMEKVEQDLVEDMIRRKSSLVKEILSVVEKEVVQLVEVSRWRGISQTVEERINEAFDEKAASLSRSLVNASKSGAFQRKRKYENIRWAGGGLVVGSLLFFFGQEVYDKIRRDQSPMETRVRLQSQERLADLENRRFNPPQTDELRESYVDAVIYTKNFSEVYLDPDFQKRLYKAAAKYLYKTWRLDEDKSLQVLATANALIKELVERKNKIHPDFVKDGIQKMRQLEKESLDRMKEILGSEVRLESFRRFERQFFIEKK